MSKKLTARQLAQFKKEGYIDLQLNVESVDKAVDALDAMGYNADLENRQIIGYMQIRLHPQKKF